MHAPSNLNGRYEDCMDLPQQDCKLLVTSVKQKNPQEEYCVNVLGNPLIPNDCWISSCIPILYMGSTGLARWGQ